MRTGKVKFFNDQKGFGFIVNPEGKDVFVHKSVIEGIGGKDYRPFFMGETVEYEAETGRKGFKATKVRRVPPTTTVPAENLD